MMHIMLYSGWNVYYNNTSLDRAESNFLDKTQTTRRIRLYTGAKLLHLQARRSRKFIRGPLKLHHVSQLYIISLHTSRPIYPPPWHAASRQKNKRLMNKTVHHRVTPGV